MGNDTLTTDRKALQINRDADKHGTFAEIGAGQEVARWFFHVGGAAGTVAKTISAYDMAVSDAIYGPAERYVSRQRLQAMLQYEFRLLLERLDKARGDDAPVFRVRRHRGDAQRHAPGRRPWLAGHPVSNRPAQRTLRDHHPRSDARQGERPPAGGARDHRREPDSRRVLAACAADPAHPLAARQSHLGTHRGGHDPLRRPGVRGRGQPPDGAPARRARSHRGGHVHGGRARRCNGTRCSTSSPCWSSAAPSAP